MTTLGNKRLIGQDPFISHGDFLAVMSAVAKSDSVNALSSLRPNFFDIKFGSYHHIPAVGAYNYDRLNRYYAYNLPEGVSDYYDETGLERDPGIQYVFSQAKYVWLSEMQNIDSMIDTPHQELLERSLDMHGDSFLVPVFGPFHRRGYCVMSFGKPKTFYDEIFSWQTQAIMQAIHIKYCMVVENFQATSRLTPREGEVLELITFGKTNPEIGAILGISANTVSGYVKQIFLKLDTKDRVTAALRARSFSLIS